MYAFCECRALIGTKTPEGKKIASEVGFFGYLREQHKVVVVPGAACGIPGYFRLSFATSTEAIERAASGSPGRARASIRSAAQAGSVSGVSARPVATAGANGYRRCQLLLLAGRASRLSKFEARAEVSGSVHKII